MAARETRRRAAADKALSSSHNKQPTSEPASNRARLHSATFPLSSATTPSLFSSFIFITALLAVLQTVASDLPLQCTRPPPSPNCGGQYGGVGFYYNASSPVPCLGWPNWGCPGNQLFATVEECQETCTGINMHSIALHTTVWERGKTFNSTSYILSPKLLHVYPKQSSYFASSKLLHVLNTAAILLETKDVAKHNILVLIFLNLR